MSYQVLTKNFPLSTTSTALTTGQGPSEAWVISSATVTNADTTSRTVTIAMDPTGSSASGNYLEYKKAVSINSSVNTALSGKNMPPGSTLYAYIDSGTSCVLSISYTVIPQAA